MPETLQRFVETLGKSQLMKTADTTLAEFAGWMVTRGILTNWQADKLKDNKFKGFYLDAYLLLDFDHADDERSYFKAKNLSTGEFVILAVQPISQNSPGDTATHYDVLPFPFMQD